MTRSEPVLQLEFRSTVIHWRGPAPFFYAPIPDVHVADVRHAARRVSYGWGVIPVEATIGDVTFTTSLFPKDGGYLLPIKADVRKRCNITVDDEVAVEMTVGPSG